MGDPGASSGSQHMSDDTNDLEALDPNALMLALAQADGEGRRAMEDGARAHKVAEDAGRRAKHWSARMRQLLDEVARRAAAANEPVAPEPDDKPEPEPEE